MPQKDTGDARARFPEMPVSEGQKHGYIGDVEVTQPEDTEPGHSNSADQPVETPTPVRSGRSVRGRR